MALQARSISPDALRARERRLIRRVVALTLPMGLAALLALPNAGPVIRTYSVPASSMAPSVPTGSVAVVSRAAYGYSRFSFDGFELPITGRLPSWAPGRGDIIVFRLTKDAATHFIKRVIGLPGETVALVKGRVVINGRTVERSETERVINPTDPARKVLVPTYLERVPDGRSYRIVEADGDGGVLDNAGPFQVPAGHVFVLGDNRDNSSDSRMMGAVGFVPIEYVVGRVIFVVGGR